MTIATFAAATCLYIEFGTIFESIHLKTNAYENQRIACLFAIGYHVNGFLRLQNLPHLCQAECPCERKQTNTRINPDLSHNLKQAAP